MCTGDEPEKTQLNRMIEASCHCGAVRMEIDAASPPSPPHWGGEGRGEVGNPSTDAQYAPLHWHYRHRICARVELLSARSSLARRPPHPHPLRPEGRRGSKSINAFDRSEGCCQPRFTSSRPIKGTCFTPAVYSGRSCRSPAQRVDRGRMVSHPRVPFLHRVAKTRRRVVGPGAATLGLGGSNACPGLRFRKSSMSSKACSSGESLNTAGLLE